MSAKTINLCIFILLCISSINPSPAPGLATNQDNQIIASGEVVLLTKNENVNNGNIEFNQREMYYS
ncbi:hypothetical protein KGM_211063 [Danaus plexippus plexippus]|uniref:Uncharacterized protein n=1 Tax=Danaus plexippus plexippus TaxID=278856 RepID=A0A212FLE2_DANPL|nr:hypothetical protein KGM_211063 [Danaus plexippus plexippus]